MKVQRTKKGNLVVRSKYDFNCAVIGMLLGDACFNRFQFTRGPEGKSKKGPAWNRTELRIYHKEGFKEYLDWKIELIKAYIDEATIYEKVKKMKNDVFKGYDAYIKHRKNFHYMYKNFYVGGSPSTNNRISGAIKIVKQSILNRVNPLSVAIWYMDDGSLYEADRRGYTKNRTISLHTDCFKYNEVEMIKQMFEDRFDIGFNIHHNSTTDKSKDYGYKLRTGKKDNIFKFIDLVEYFVKDVKCMNYKLPE